MFQHRKILMFAALTWSLLSVGRVEAGNWLLIGEDSSIRIVEETTLGSSMLEPPLGSGNLMAVSSNGGGVALVSGSSDRTDLLDEDGLPTDSDGPFSVLNTDSVDVLSWNGSEWLACGMNGIISLVDAAGTPAGVLWEAFDLGQIRGVSWLDSHWLIAGSSGQFQRVNSAGLPITPLGVTLDGRTLRTVASDGAHWLVGGDGDRVWFIDPEGTLEEGELITGLDTINDLSWNGVSWLAVGNGGQVQALNPDGTTASSPTVAFDAGEYGAALTVSSNGSVGGHSIVAGSYGRARLVDSSGTPLGSTVTLLGGQDVNDVTWMGSSWLAVGVGGAVQRVTSSSGELEIDPRYDQAFTDPVRGTDVGWSGRSWLVVGADSARIVSESGELTEPEQTIGLGSLLEESPVLSWSGEHWLVGSSNGLTTILNENGESVEGTASVVALLGHSVLAAAWNGSAWLVGGNLGLVQRMNRDGTRDEAAGTPATLDAMPVNAIIWNGTNWLVAGNGGRVQQVSSSGSPLIDIEYVLSNANIQAASFNGTNTLIGGDGGLVQLVTANGEAIADTPPFEVMSGANVHSISWSGTRWLVGGAYGNSQWVNSDGTMDTEPINTLGWAQIDGIASAAPLANGEECSDWIDCASRSCRAGLCCTGCVIEGVCLETGIIDTENSCLNCQPDVNPTDWSVREGVSCDDGLWCTQGDSCNRFGVCSGPFLMNCSPYSDECNEGACNEETDECEPDPTPLNGTSCADGVYCNGDEICAGGVCQDGTERDCSAITAGLQCSNAYCDDDPEVDDCRLDHSPLDGAPCDDGYYCNGADTCDDGVCVNTGTDVSCSSHDDDLGCAIGVCDEDTNNCAISPQNIGDFCRAGFCNYDTGAATPPAVCSNEGTCPPGLSTPCLAASCMLGICGIECTLDRPCPPTAICHPILEICRPPNRPPIAQAGEDQEVGSGETITLDGSESSDPDGDEISFMWEIVDGPEGLELSDPELSTPTFVAPPTPIENSIELTFSLVVSDYGLDSEPSEIYILVFPDIDNTPPVAIIGGPDRAAPGRLVTMSGADSYDPDEDLIVSYSWEQTLGPRVDDLWTVDEAELTFTIPDAQDDSTVTLQLIVSDGFRLSAPALASIIVDSSAEQMDEDDDVSAPEAVDGGFINAEGSSYDMVTESSEITPSGPCGCITASPKTTNIDLLSLILLGLWIHRRRG